MLKHYICMIAGIAGAYIADLFGGWTTALSTLVIFMTVDFGTGLAAAGFFGNSHKSESGGLSSEAGFRGIVKKIVILAVVVVAHRLDLLIDVNYIRNAAIIGFSMNELISIVENVGLMGVTLPGVITKAIDILNSRADGEEKSDENN